MTTYADPIATAGLGDSRIERIFVHGTGQEEIRHSWWPGGRFVPRPLDSPETEMVDLQIAGIWRGVYSKKEMLRLAKEIIVAVADPNCPWAK
jgi:hypothetical protein